MPDAAKLAREKLWGDALAAALRFALHLTRNSKRAEELAAEALAVSLDPERSPWDPSGETTLRQHVVNVVRGLVKAESRKKRLRDDATQAMVAERMRPWVPRPDGRILAQQKKDRGEQRRQQVRAGLNQLARQALDLFGEGLAPAEQAARLGVAPNEIYEARRQIAERVRALPDDADTRDDRDDLSWLDPEDDEDDTEEDEVVP